MCRSKEPKAILRPSLRRHVFFRILMRKGIRVPLPYAQASRTFGCASGLIRQCGAHAVFVVDIVTIVVDITHAIDSCGFIIVVTGRTEPPVKTLSTLSHALIIQGFFASLKHCHYRVLRCHLPVLLASLFIHAPSIF